MQADSSPLYRCQRMRGGSFLEHLTYCMTHHDVGVKAYQSLLGVLTVKA